MREESEYMFDEGQTLEIVQKYEFMLKRKKKFFFDVYEFESIIDYYLNTEHSHQALQAANLAQSMHPYSFEIQLRRAELLIIEGKFDDALQILALLSNIEPTNSEVHFLTGNARLMLEDYKAAEAEFSIAIENEHEDKPHLMYRIAGLYQEEEEYHVAIRYLLSAYQTAPNYLNVLFDVAYCFERVDNISKSQEYYNKYLDINPFSSNVWYNLGIVYARQGNMPGAIEAYDYALAVEPSNSSALHNMASTLAISEKYHEAIELFQELAYLEPENPKVYCSIGECYLRLRNYSKALDAFQKSLSILPTMAEALYGIGMVKMEMKQLRSAREYMQKAINIDGENYDFWLGFAHINFELNLYQETLDAYQEAIIRNPADPDAFLGLSEVLLHYKQYSQVESLYQDIALNFSDIPMLKVILAAAQYLSNKPSAAIQTLKLAKRIDPEAINTFLSFVSVSQDKEFRSQLATI